MAKATGPVFSLMATGSLGKTVTYTDQPDIGSVVRPYAIPRNPRSTAQSQVRQCMQWASKLWNAIDASAQDPWFNYLNPRRGYDPYEFRGAQVRNLRSSADLDGFQFSRIINAGVPCRSVTVTPGAGQLTVAAPTPPTLAGLIDPAAVFFLLIDQDPHGDPVGTIATAFIVAAPWQHTFTGLTGGQRYRVGAAYGYTNTSNGRNAYGLAASAWGTPA